MTGSPIVTGSLIAAGMLMLAVAIAWVRLWLWWRSAPRDASAPAWRPLVLATAQPACAALLFLCLFPPSQPGVGGTLVVATAGAPTVIASGAGDRLVVLPEGPTVSGAERVPDLGTALRRHPDVRSLRVLGSGLTPRDVEAVQGRVVHFEPSLPKPGLVALVPPPAVAPGASFTFGGQVAGLTGVVVELLDPAGQVTDRQRPDEGGAFVLGGTARSAGVTTFQLRLKTAGGRIVEQADVPVRVQADAAPRLLILAGAPGPEVKYLRRWAADAGFVVNTQMSAGGGLALGDPPLALDAATLRRFDVAIVDDRSWTGRRGVLTAAARDGLGLVLRAGGPLDGATQAEWRSLGFSMSGTNALVPIVLPATGDADMARTRRGIGSADTPDDLQVDGEVLPEVSRLALAPAGSEAVPLVRDAGGATLAAWRGIGAGRVAVFTGIDSYGLTLTGRRALFNDWWSAILSATARPGSGAAQPPMGPKPQDAAWVGERVVLCGVAAGATVQAPNGTQTLLQADGDGCAGFWPVSAGWHALRRLGASAGPAAFYVWPADQLAGLRAARDRQATLMLTGTVAHQPAAARGGDMPGTPTRGPSWPWFLGWLALSGGLWAFERSRIGRPPAAR
ncbi:hypothetical protein BH10PSE2_BH10PSE2_09740 [soil metagenome]